MIDIHPLTGADISGPTLLSARFERLLTTRVKDRIKRRNYGNPAIAYQGKLNNPHNARIIQNLTLKALAEPINGMTDFKASVCHVSPTPTGFSISVSGVWKHASINLETVINES